MVPLPILITSRLGILAFTPLPVYRFPNNLAPNLPNNILRNPSFLFFCFIFNCFLKPFINKPDSLRDLTIFMISSISSIKTLNAVVPDPTIFLSIPASTAAAAAAVNPNCIF